MDKDVIIASVSPHTSLIRNKWQQKLEMMHAILFTVSHPSSDSSPLTIKRMGFFFLRSTAAAHLSLVNTPYRLQGFVLVEKQHLGEQHKFLPPGSQTLMPTFYKRVPFSNLSVHFAKFQGVLQQLVFQLDTALETAHCQVQDFKWLSHRTQGSISSFLSFS